MVVKIITGVLLWVLVCFVMGAVETYLERRRWEKEQEERNRQRLPSELDR